MLGMLTSSIPVLPPSSKKSCWGYWVDHILKQSNLGIRKAALLSASTGSVVASSGFSLSDKDVAVSVLFSYKALCNKREEISKIESVL